MYVVAVCFVKERNGSFSGCRISRIILLLLLLSEGRFFYATWWQALRLGATVLHHRRSPIVHATTGRCRWSCVATTATATTITTIPPITIPHHHHHAVHLPRMIKAAAATR